MRLLMRPDSAGGPYDLELSGSFSKEKQTAWQAAVDIALRLFEKFAELGGLGPISLQSWTSGKLVWNPVFFTYTWSTFPFDAAGLAVLLRMLSALRVEGEALDSRTLSGRLVSPGHPWFQEGIDKLMHVLPQRVTVPFALDICPYGSWINIECVLLEGFSPRISAELDDGVRTWGRIADAGGFQIDDEEEGSHGVDIVGPTVGEDFIEWHCLMTRVPVGSLDGLVNVLSLSSDRIAPIRSVYVG